MTRAKISEYSATANDNTDVNGINIAEGCPPSSMNNMGREIMAALKRFQVGSDGDGVTVGGNLIVSGTVTAANTATLGNVTSAAFAAGSAGSPTIHAAGDTNTGIFFPAADTIAFAEGGAEAMRIDSSGNVGIGETSPSAPLHIKSATNNIMRLQSSDATTGNIYFSFYNSSGTQKGYIGYGNSGDDALQIQNEANSYMTFATNGTERTRIDSSGNLLVGKTTANQIGDRGFEANSVGVGFFTAAGETCINVNRKTNDGVLIQFWQDTVAEGNISVSGNTVSYNAFSGGHWSQLQEGRGYNPNIPRGTVMSTIGEMCLWKSVEWTETTEHPAIPAVEAKEAVLDEEGNVIEPAVEAVEGKDAWTETSDKRESYLGQLPVGATFEEDGFTKTVVDDGNERLPKVKISDVVGDKAVYGVFQTWDEVQDMVVTSLGAFVVRIAAGVTVEIGDLLESNGDGCAKVQDDDVIRSKTIAKVTSTTPTATYDDGSYTVPAVIYCG